MANRGNGAASASEDERSRRDAPPTVDLWRPDHLPDLVYLVCFRKRKFARFRFARLVLERIGPSKAAARLVPRIPVETLALFLSREVRTLSEDRAPLNECFELPDGDLLEYVGEHMDAAETVLRLLALHDESRLQQLVELLRLHDRAWLHTLAIEARDARLAELGFPDLHDVERLFVNWHRPLLLRKLESATLPRVGGIKEPATPMTADTVLQYVHNLREPPRDLCLDRLHFLMICQAVQDAEYKLNRMTSDTMQRSARHALEVLAKGLAASGSVPAWLASPQISTIYRLGLAGPSAATTKQASHLTTRK